MSLNELTINDAEWGGAGRGTSARPFRADGESGGGGLRARVVSVEMLRRLYPVVTLAGAGVLLACGGFVPILRRWLSDEIRLGSPADLVSTLGGVWLGTDRCRVDAEVGPPLERTEAAALYEEIESVARRLGATAPAAVRLTFLPCCGVLAWGRDARSRALVVGLPLLQVLDRGELRAVLAHELTHLARGDAARLARTTRFVERLEEGLDDADGGRAAGPLAAWARWAYRRAESWISPLARAQEERADRLAASVAGGGAAASALVKVALIQPIFRELLEHHDPSRPGRLNLYATFRTLWRRLPPETLTALRHAALADRRPSASSTHPHLIDRLAIVQGLPDRPFAHQRRPASSLLADLEHLEQDLDRRLFALERPQPSVFHRAGS